MSNGVSWLMQPNFRSEGVQKTVDRYRGELGGFMPSGSGGGVGSILGKEKPTDHLLAILHSRTVAMEIIQSLDLIPIIFTKK